MLSIIEKLLRRFFDIKLFPNGIPQGLTPDQANELAKAIDTLREMKNKDFEGFDKTILAVSSAGLGWIFVNIDKFKTGLTGVKWIILSFAISVISSASSFYCAAYGNKRHIEDLKKALETFDLNHMVNWTWQMRFASFFNFISFGSFVAGLIITTVLVFEVLK